MTEQEVVELMASSQTEDEWNRNADKVKTEGGGHYPKFWFRAVILSGIAAETAGNWGGDGQIKIVVE